MNPLLRRVLCTCVAIGVAGGMLQLRQIVWSREIDSTAETLLRGIENRAQMVGAVTGRVVIAYKTSDEFAEMSAIRQEEATEGHGRQEGHLHVGMADFEYNNFSWRVELRDVVQSGMDWVGFPALHLPTKEKTRTGDLYNASVRNGEYVFTYDRATRTGSVRTFDQSQRWRPGTIGLVDSLFVVTVPGYLPKLFRDEMEVHMIGVEELDGVDCYKLAAIGLQEGAKGYMRLWVCPDRDFGVLRYEHVEVTDTGELLVCEVQRAYEWRKEGTTQMWAPRRSQLDNFQYKRLDPAGWAYSRVVVCEELTMSEEAAREPSEWAFPFDTRVWDDRSGTLNKDPTEDVAQILETLRFTEPDEFGQAVMGAELNDLFRR